MASSTVVSLSTTATFAAADVRLPMRRKVAAAATAGRVWFPARRSGFAVAVRSSGSATPPGLSDQVSDSIKKAEETCDGEGKSGECAAAWDEVEELSAAASHARDKLKEENDPLEKYCKENPESDECRVYDN